MPTARSSRRGWRRCWECARSGVCVRVAGCVVLIQNLQCECRAFTAADAERGDPLLQSHAS
jgi:hypothetical protein